MTKVIFFGDPDSTTDAEDIYSAIDKEENVDLYVNGGDNFYDEEYDKGKAIIRKHFPDGSEKRKKLRIVLGNHEHESSEGPEAEALMGEIFPDLFKTKPGFDTGDSSWEKPKWLWSEHLNNELYFIGLNSEDEDIGFKRNQYNWAISELDKAKELRKQNKCRWIIGGVHKPWVTKKSSHSAYTNVREVFGDDFFNVVNQMWFGHNHNDHIFRSWKAIKKEGNSAIEIVESLLPDGKTIDHSKTHGMTGNIQGHAGHEHNKFKENMEVPEIIWHNESTFSYAVIETNGNILNTKYKDKSGKVLFEYDISDTTDYSNGTIPIPDPDPDLPPCPDGQCRDRTTKECRPIGLNETVDAQGYCMSTTPNPEPTPDTKLPKCDQGYELKIVDGKCVCVKIVDNHGCGINEYWNEELQQCIPVLKPKFAKCKDGEHWDYNKNVCVLNEPGPIPECQEGYTWSEAEQACVKDIIIDPDPINGDLDVNGILWLVAKGKQHLVRQSRDEATDDRWSENIPNCETGFEATMIAKSEGTNSSSHFAMKQGGSNHSKGDWKNERWLDTGARVDGTIQLQYEGPHPKNHNFKLDDKFWFIKKLNKGLEGNWIGFKWAQQKLKGADGSPANGGIRWRMWKNEAISPDGKPDNTKWELVYDFIDGVDAQIIQPQDYVMKGTMDAEVRRSDTDKHTVYAGGLHVRELV